MTTPWKMPDWMEQFRDLIGNTGGNLIEDLMVDRTPVSINAPRALMVLAVASQIELLERLHAGRLLADELIGRQTITEVIADYADQIVIAGSKPAVGFVLERFAVRLQTEWGRKS